MNEQIEENREWAELVEDFYEVSGLNLEEEDIWTTEEEEAQIRSMMRKDDESTFTKRAHTLGSMIIGSIKLGRKENGPIVLFINSDVYNDYEVIGFLEASRLMQSGVFLESFENDYQFLSVTFFLSTLLRVKNWQKYKSVVPYKYYRLACMNVFTFALLIYSVKTPEELEIAIEGGRAMFQDVLDIGQGREKYLNKSYLHRLIVFCEIHMKEKMLTETITPLEKLNSVQMSELDSIDVRYLGKIQEWRKIVNIVIVSTPDYIADDVTVERLKATSDEIIKNEENRKDEKRMAEEESRRFNPKPFRDKKKEIIGKFFSELGIVKAMGTTGIVYSLNTLPGLINYCQKLISNVELKYEDRIIVLDCRDRLMSCLDEGEVKPLSTLQQIIKTLWLEIIDKTSLDGKVALQELLQKFLESSEYSEAWNYALRFKGLSYEVLFAQTYGLNFVPENCKMSLAGFISTNYPEKYSEFLKRSIKNTFIRDLKPDFILHRKDYPLRPMSLELWRQSFLGKEKIVEDYEERSEIEEEDLPIIQPERKYSSSREKSLLSTHKIKAILEAVERKQGEYGLIERTDDKSELNKLNLTIIEVGYQTASENKVKIDMDKWRPAKNVLDSMGFNFTIISVADSTKAMKETTWLDNTRGKLLVNSIGKTFGLLTANMPPGMSDISVGEISTQKLRSRVAADHKRKTPVTEYDLVEYQSKWKEDIFKRPSGCTIPIKLQKQFVRTNILGSTISKSDTEKIFDMINHNTGKIIDSVSKSSLKFEILNDKSWIKFLFGCYEEDFLSIREIGCSEFKVLCNQILESWNDLKRDKESDNKAYQAKCDLLSIQMNEFQKRVNTHKDKENHICKRGINPVKSSNIKDVMLIGCNRNILDKSFKSKPPKSTIDELCNQTFAGRTGKQKETKGLIVRFLESTSRCLGGCLRDSKGLILSPYKDILRKSGVVDRPNKGEEEVIEFESTLSNMTEKDIETTKKERKSKLKRVQKPFLRPDANWKNYYKYASEKLDAIMKKKDTLTPKVIETLSKLKKELEVIKKNQNEDSTCEEFVLGLEPNSYIHGEYLQNSIYELLKESIHTDPLNLMFSGFREKVSKFKDVEDKRYGTFSANLLAQHFESLEPLLHVNSNEYEIPEIFDEVIKRACRQRYSDNDLNGRILEDIMVFCELFMTTGLGKALYFYSKLCEIFLNFVSEMTYSGLKIMKIKGFNLNLLCKVNKNKTNNCSCMILDNDFRRVCKPFFMNRNRATLGQAYLYCVILNTYQAIQTQGGYEFISNSKLDYHTRNMQERINSFAKQLFDKMNECYSSGIASAVSRYKTSHASTGESGHNIGLNTMCCLIVNYSLIFSLSFLNNSRKISKLTQMVRYPIMISLSEFGFPKGVGGKLDCQIRKSEDHLLKTYITFVSCVNIKNRKIIVENWIKNEPFNARDVLSIEIFPFSCKSPRQVASDMYICHMYNKEDDNFSEGSIRVVNEVCDKIIDWEKEVKEQCEIYEKSKESNNRESLVTRTKSEHRLRSLLGIKNVEIKSKEIEEEMVISRNDKSSSSEKKSESDRDSESGALTTPGSSSSSRTRTVSSIDAESIVSSTHLSERTPNRSVINSISKSSVEFQVDDVCRKMYKFTFGCPELCQAFAERSKKIYTAFNINNALKSKRNNEQISSITETTSIISDPHPDFNLESSIKTVLLKDSIKLAKTISRTTRETMSTNVKYKSFEREMSRILLLDDDERNVSAEEFKKKLEEVRKKSKMDWSTIINMDINTVILTDNCSHIFIFVKTLWKKIKQMMGRDRQNVTDGSNEFVSGLMKAVETHSNLTQFNSVGGSETMRNTEEILDNLRAVVLNMIINEFIKGKKIDLESLKSRMCELSYIFVDIESGFSELNNQTTEYPGASFPDIESDLINLEYRVMNEFSNEIFLTCLLMCTNQIITVFTFSSDTLNHVFLRSLKTYVLDMLSSDVNDPKSFKGTNNNTLKILYEHMNKSEFLKTFLQEKFDMITDQSVDRLFNYCELLISNIKKPISMKLMGVARGIRNISDIFDTLKSIIANSSFKEMEFDFSLTILNCVKGSLQMCRKLLDRKEKGIKLPRGTRSKVIFEMIKLTKTLNTTSVQELGFQIALDSNNRFYAGIAPKAQIGGDRDLLVMSDKMKVATHCTEACSKALMESSVVNDGLTNKNLKEIILDKSRDNMLQKSLSEVLPHIDKETKLFSRVLNIAGDNTKWGPIHCTTYFSIVMQQLLSDFPDWSCFYRMIMLKSIIKQLEIPCASMEKIIHSLIMNGEFRQKLRNLKKEGDEERKREIMVEVVNKEWNTNEIVKKICSWYLRDGKSYIGSYNHMGQGIHHATSSLFANVCQMSIDEIITTYIEKKMKNCTVMITHAGSSDDFAKSIVITGQVPSDQYEILETIYPEVMRDCLNLMNGLMRCCQMMVSEKTVCSPIVAEFYSEFCFFDKVCPSTKKFLTSQIINNSVTSPLTLYQATHVECQQAMYMGVPLCSIIMLALFKQMIFIGNSVDLYQKYGELILNSVSIIGRLYLPKYSTLTSNSTIIDDLQTLLKSVRYLIRFCNVLPSDNRTKLSPLLTKIDALSSQEKLDMFFDKPRETSSPTRDLEDSRSSDSAELVESSDSKSISTELGFKNITSSDENVMELDIQELSEFHLSSLLTIILFKYYTSGSDYQSNEGMEKVSNWSGSTLLKDPFSQMLPESIRNKIEQIKTIRSEMQDMNEIIKGNKNPLKSIALTIIAKNVVTENYEFEVGRLQQALESQNIIWGLAGGIRQISVPIHRQTLRSYFFENKLPVEFKDTWVTKDKSKFISGSGGYVPPNQRIRFANFLDKVKEIRLKKTLVAVEINTIFDIPIEIVQEDDKTLTINIDQNGLYSLEEVLLRTVDELKDSTYHNLETLEQSKFVDFDIVIKPTVKKTKLLKAEKLNVFRNFPPVIAAAIINQDALYEARPQKLDYAYITSDISALENNFPSIVRQIKSINSELLETINKTKDGVLDLRSSELHSFIDSKSRDLINTSRILSKQRQKYQKLFLLSEQEADTKTTDSNVLYSYNTVENLKVVYEHTELLKVQDEIMWTLSCVINCINWYYKTNDNKNDILLKFLRCNLKELCSKCLKFEGTCHFCRLMGILENQLPEGTVENMFFNESKNMRNVTKQRNYMTLSKLSSDNFSLLRGSEGYEYRTELDYRGNLDSGMFVFSSNEGTATGYVRNRILYIMLSSSNPTLLTSLESPILQKFKLNVLTSEGYRSREQFFRLLPKLKEIRNKLIGDYLIVQLNKDSTFSISRKGTFNKEAIGEPRVCFLSQGNLVNRYKSPIMNSKTINLKWTSKYLYIYSEIVMREVEPADSIEKVFHEMTMHLDKKEIEQIRDDFKRSTRRELLTKIDISSPAPQQSIAILHALNKHSVGRLAGNVEITEWTIDEAPRLELSDTNLKEKMNMKSKPGSPEFFNDRIEPLINKLKGLETVWPITHILDFYGYSNIGIDFDGIDEVKISSVGSWKVNFEQSYRPNTLFRIIDDIIKLDDRRITRETIFMMKDCEMNTTTQNDLRGILECFKNSEMEKYYLIFSIYCLSIVVVNTMSKLLNVSLKQTCMLAQRISESNPSIKIKVGDSLEVLIIREISKSEESPSSMKFGIHIKKTSRTVSKMLKTSIEESFPLMVQLLKKVEKVKPILMNDMYMFDFDLFRFCNSGIFLETLEEISEKLTPEKYVKEQKKLLFSLFRICSDNINLEMLSNQIKKWYVEGKEAIEEQPRMSIYTDEEKRIMEQDITQFMNELDLSSDESEEYSGPLSQEVEMEIDYSMFDNL